MMQGYGELAPEGIAERVREYATLAPVGRQTDCLATPGTPAPPGVPPETAAPQSHLEPRPSCTDSPPNWEDLRPRCASCQVNLAQKGYVRKHDGKHSWKPRCQRCEQEGRPYDRVTWQRAKERERLRWRRGRTPKPGCRDCGAVRTRKGARRCDPCRAGRADAVRKKPRVYGHLRHRGARCEICDFVPLHPGQLDVDHIQPLKRGGADATANYQTLCKNCHALKTILNRENGTRRSAPAVPILPRHLRIIVRTRQLPLPEEGRSA